jgi:membrane protein
MGRLLSVRPALAAVALGGRRFWAQNMPHHAAALTYYSVLALFQAMLIAIALLGLLGSHGTLDQLVRFLERHGADRQLVESLTAAGRDALAARGTSAAALAAALAIALVVTSSAFVAATTALNVVLEAQDVRPLRQRWLHAIGATSVTLVLGLGAVIAVFLGGGLAAAVFDGIGLGGAAQTVWQVVRLPIAALLAMTAFAWTYYAAPTVPNPRWRWITLGAAVAVVVWLLASLALFAFAASFGTFDSTYGSFATAVLLLVWLFVTNAAMLFGAEVNAGGRFAEGVPTPLTPTGHPPEEAQHQAARHAAGHDRPGGVIG